MVNYSPFRWITVQGCNLDVIVAGFQINAEIRIVVFAVVVLVDEVFIAVGNGAPLGGGVCLYGFRVCRGVVIPVFVGTQGFGEFQYK
ncbi:MAG: hypothetical protein LBK64_04205 [Spirochaetaceae bacterium]|nr:hypothetical protein [Spirochaetaceae bacterium]